MKKRWIVSIAALALMFVGKTNAQDSPGQTKELITEPFNSSWKSLERYSCPEWFRDAKFGIWTCWNPYTVPAVGDWYARNMYIEGSGHYNYHLENYGHPSKVGYKDIVEMWKGEKFDPENLVALFKEAGAKYIVAMAVHHDNLDLWDSRHHEWNSVNHGPHQNIIGKWESAVRKSGLHWGVTSHLERAWNWFAVSHGADSQGEYAGVPYDGADPKYAGLYFKEYAGHSENDYCYALNPPREVIEDYFARIKDLLDQHKPDLFYFDGGIPFGETGRKLLAYYYNTNAANHNGSLEAVMCIKNFGGMDGFNGDNLRGGVAINDVESGQLSKIGALPWQTDASIGDWFWTRECKYDDAKNVIDRLIDIVSKNGNLLLNVPPRADGTLDDKAIALLKEIGGWLRVNGEGIYGTRPYSIYGEGPTKVADSHFSGMATLTEQDCRFTAKGDTVYVFVCGTPAEQVSVKTFSAKKYYRIKSVSMLGVERELKFEQKDDALHVILPETKPCNHAICLKIIPDLIPVPESLETLFAQEVVRDKETQQAYVKVEPLKPEIKQFEPFIWKSETPGDCPFTQSKTYSQVKFLGVKSGFHFADTWYPTWGDDGLLYSPYTDGGCWRLDGSSDWAWSAGETATTGHAVMEGDDPLSLVVYSLGVRIASSKPYEGRYPCGSLMYNGVWYYGTYCLGPSGSAKYGDMVYNWPWLGPFVGFRTSTDKGRSWQDCPHTPAKSLFGENGLNGYPVKIGSPHFVDFGKNMEYSPDGKAYMVAHGADINDPKPRFWNASWITGDNIYLLRVTPSPENMNDASKWEFYAGKDATGKALWTNDFSQIKPLLEWNNNMGCVTVTYNAALKRYLMCVTDGGNTCAKMHTYIMESDSLTGEWKLISYMKNFGEQAYFVNIPSKYISKDGETMWLWYSGNFAVGWNGAEINTNPQGGHYGLVMQKIRIVK